MKLRFYPAKAFTLTEVIVGLVVVSIIGAAAWMAVNVLSPASQATRLRIKAEHLITLSEEELHQYAQNQAQFDTTLNNCNFDQPNNTCGFPDVSGQFPEFNLPPTLTYLAADSTTDLKKFDIHVTWAELGKIQSKDSVILLVRPSDPLPGNIYGLVTNINTGAILGNAQIVAQNLSTPNTNTTYSQAALIARADGNRANYTFAQPNTGYFVLGAGTWQVTATLAGYNNYTYPQDIVINGSDEQEVDLKMTPLLTPATISGNLVNTDPTGPQPSFTNNSIIQLDEGGAPPSNVSPMTFNGNSFSFNVSFSDPNKRCFTLSTLNAYHSKWVGNYSCNSFPFQADGWSSAQASSVDAVLNCAEPGVGDTAGDSNGVPQICVTPGQTFNENIPLVAVPTATVTALVIDQTGKPITTPIDIDVYWQDGTFYNQQNYTASSDGLGHYLVTVPAEQDLFPAAPGDEVQVFAEAAVPVLQCCNQTSTVERQSPTQRVGPLHSGDNLSTTLTINTITTPQQCGNAYGLINDDKTNVPLSDASVTIAGINQSTIDGSYIFQCTQTPPFRIPTGNKGVTANDNGYYSFSSAGNSFYNATGSVSIPANLANNLGTIGLWPMGYGTITGTVVEIQQGTNIPINGVPVVLALGTGGTRTFTTGSDGKFEFDNVQETWPPTVLIGNPKYNQTPLNHALSVTASSTYNAYSGPAFTLQAGQIQNITIVLTPKAGV